MNIQLIIERIKKDRILQIIILIVIIFLFIFILRTLFSSSKKSETPCYNVTLTIWSPFATDNFLPLISELNQYCIQFNLVEKSIEEIKRDLIYSLAINEFPDIVYLNEDYLLTYREFFATATPVNLDSLVAYYNKDVLNFFQIKKPKLIDDLKIFINEVKNIQQSPFYAVGLGTKDIKNRKEIILTFMTQDKNYQQKDTFRQNFQKAIYFYRQFQDPESDFYSYSLLAGNDLINFAQEKLAMFIGFYKDKKEILNLNPRINYEIDFLPNTFPPKMRVYNEIFYFVPLKKSKNLKLSLDFLDYFSKYKLKEFSDVFDLVPVNEQIIDNEEKRIVFNTARNFGETFSFLNKELIFENLDNILNALDNKNEYEMLKIIEIIYNSL